MKVIHRACQSVYTGMTKWPHRHDKMANIYIHIIITYYKYSIRARIMPTLRSIQRMLCGAFFKNNLIQNEVLTWNRR